MHRNVGRKIVRAYENLQQPNHCIVNLYQLNMSKRPHDLVTTDFYLRPLANYHNDNWYCCQPIGQNTLSKVISNLAKAAGLVSNYSNHLLLATAASRLYNANVDEQLITEVTGHHSNAVRSCKHTSNDQLKSVSNVLYGGNFENKDAVAECKVEHEDHKMQLDCNESPCKKAKVDIDVPQKREKTQFSVSVTVNINQ